MQNKKQKLTPKEQKVQAEFLRTLKIFKRKTQQQIIVAMIGLVGSGKSSVAKQIAKLIGATVISSDFIRMHLRKQKESFENVRKIVENIAKEVINQGGNVVLDSDFVDVKKRTDLKKLLKNSGIKIIFMRTFCERDIMINRLRRANYTKVVFFKNANIALREMWRRTPHHYAWENKGGGNWILRKMSFVDFEIDTTHTKMWQKQIKNVLKTLGVSAPEKM